jgi:hypothetical protein
MGRDLSAIGEYFSHTENIREVNDVASQIAMTGKVIGIMLTASSVSAPEGVGLIGISGTVSLITDATDIGLDVAEGKIARAVVKASFFGISFATGGLIGRAQFGETGNAVAGAAADLIMSGMQNMSTSEME